LPNPQETNIDRLLLARAEIDEQLRQHKTPLTVVFTDVVGSTSYFDRYGDTSGLAMLRRHADLAESIFERFQGRVIKTIGDSVMAEFPQPLSAVRAAVELQRGQAQANQGFPERERIQLRIGIHTGNGFRYGGDVYGDVVNVAARVTKRTGPAQILVSGEVREAIGNDPELRWNCLGKITMAGKSEKEDVFEVVWTDTLHYTELRRGLNAALAEGKLAAPGLRLDELVERVQPAAPGSASTTGESGLAPAAPQLPARYEVLGEVGRGGMGIVYKARDLETSEVVAVKVLKPEIAADPTVTERFKNELRLARKITHKNVCRLHEFSRAGDVSYITMEFVEGESLRVRLNRAGKLDLSASLDLARQIAEALQEAHSQGVVHRDLKPENVVVTPDGHVRVMDFGIARSLDATRSGQTMTLIGTPAYMAPEQALGKPIDHRADIYAFGIMLYEMVTGRPAFQADTPMAVLLQQVTGTPQSPRDVMPTLPVYVSDVILRCLEKEPDKRFGSMEELLAALSQKEAISNRKQRSKQNTIGPAETSTRLTPSPEAPDGSSRQWLRAAGVIVLLALAGGGIFATLRLKRGEKTAPESLPNLTGSSRVVSTPAPVAAPSVPAPPAPQQPTTAGARAEVQAPEGDAARVQSKVTPVNRPQSQPLAAPPNGSRNPEQAPQVRQWLQEGYASMQARQYDQAAAAFQRVLAVAPYNQPARTGLDRLDLLKNAETPPRNPEPGVRAELNRADLLLQNGEYAGAISAFQAVLERNPNNPRARNGLARARKAKMAAARSNPLLGSK
jgi:serine/threonine protein kinase/class 3 adenylate cyclase